MRPDEPVRSAPPPRLGRRGRAERAFQGRARRGERRTWRRTAALARARSIATGNGVRYAYTGNVYDPAGQGTRCHKCGALVIKRDWYRPGYLAAHRRRPVRGP
jgi:hypothetical protein